MIWVALFLHSSTLYDDHVILKLVNIKESFFIASICIADAVFVSVLSISSL